MTICSLGCGLFSPKNIVGNIEVNNPWLTIEPGDIHEMTTPFGDKDNLDVVYLTFVTKEGDAIRVDLKTKQITQYHFPVKNWNEIDKFAIHWKRSDYSSTWTEFRGKREIKKEWSLFGYPFPDRVGKTLNEYRT